MGQETSRAQQANLPPARQIPAPAARPGVRSSSGIPDHHQFVNPLGDNYGGYGSDYDYTTEYKAQELCGILKALEAQLEDPHDFVQIGRTYRGLSEWTWEHSQDSDFSEVLAMLAPESMYPAWRRQALEEAYMLFFEDCAKQGNPKALDHLPEPPTSKEIGYRPLPEALLDPKTTRGAAFSNTYEVGNACCIRRSWNYDVIRNGPRPRPGEKRAAGRKIVAKDSAERYCTCAVDPLTRLVQAFTPESFCCGRDRKAVADAAAATGAAPGMQADSPNWPPPPGSSRSAANTPSASAKIKPTRFSQNTPGPTPTPLRFPDPPQNGTDEVPELASGRRARAEQQLFSEQDPSKRALHL